MVAVDAIVVAPIAVDAVEDEVIIILALPMQQREVYVPILAKMCLTMVKSLQQIKCVPHGKSLYSMLAPPMDKILTTNCRTGFGSFSPSLYTPTMSLQDIV
jgi:hypothetical protein